MKEKPLINFFPELNALPQSKLLALTSELEQLIQLHNADLVNELARRDELEYEKEVRNKFITLLVAIQEQQRRRLHHQQQPPPQQQASVEKRRSRGSLRAIISGDSIDIPIPTTPTTIPYDPNQPTPNITTLEALIKR